MCRRQREQKSRQWKAYRKMVLEVQESCDHKTPMGEEQAQLEEVEAEDQVEEGVGEPGHRGDPPTQRPV